MQTVFKTAARVVKRNIPCRPLDVSSNLLNCRRERGRPMTSRHPPSFGRWLTATGLLSEAELARAEAQRQSTGERLPDTLVRLGLSSADEVAQALARHLEIGYVDRTEFPSSPPFLQRLSPQYMRQYRFCPLAVDGGALVVACADPTDPTVVDELRGDARARDPPGGGDRGGDPRGDRALLRRGLHRGPEDHRGHGRGRARRRDRERGRDLAPRHGVRGAGGAAREPPGRERDQGRAPRTSTSSRSRTPCASATASTACSSTRRRRPSASRRRSPRASRSWRS